METIPVITYRLAYLDRQVTLCAECIVAETHGAGVLGPVQHGLYRGLCRGLEHRPARAERVMP